MLDIIKDMLQIVIFALTIMKLYKEMEAEEKKRPSERKEC